MLTEVDNSNFEARLMSPGIALVDCWAPGCGACKKFAPTFEAAADRYPTHTFAKLNIRKIRASSQKTEGEPRPDHHLVRDSLLLLRQPGCLTRQEIDEATDATAEGLDMERVRGQIWKSVTHR